MSSKRLGTSVAGLLVVVLLFTCGENGPSGEGDAGLSNTKCAKGLKAMGPACVPIFDECQDDEVPVLGGGCRHVGPPKTCLKGWAKVRGGWCEPILPNSKCPPGTMEVIGKSTCQPVGPPTKCLKGWALVKGGWCEPILPKNKCPMGTMEVIGKATCQPIGDCGSGTWGKIKTTASTIFVDQSYAGGVSDGSQSKPFKTIGAALYKAAPGDHISIAAGTYKENINIQRKVTLEGRCAQKVTIAGGSKDPVVEMTKWASGAVLRGVTISGTGAGLDVDGVDVTVERVAVSGCEGWGVMVDNGGNLALRDSLVFGNREVGVGTLSASAKLERTVVRDTRERASDKTGGSGVQAIIHLGQSQRSRLSLVDSLVSGNRTFGISVWSSKAELERTVVRHTREQLSDMKLGSGIHVAVQPGQSQGSELILQDSLVAGNRSVGIGLLSSKATIRRSVVRDTSEQTADKKVGFGIAAVVSSGQSKGSALFLQNCEMARR